MNTAAPGRRDPPGDVSEPHEDVGGGYGELKPFGAGNSSTASVMHEKVDTPIDGPGRAASGTPSERVRADSMGVKHGEIKQGKIGGFTRTELPIDPSVKVRSSRSECDHSTPSTGLGRAA